MIGYLSGKIMRNENGKLLLVLGQIGYEVNTPYTELLMGSEIDLYTYTHVRENEISIYGFQSWDQKELFEKLLTVNGVGPKSALSLLTLRTVGEIVNAILKNEPSMLKVSGVGVKTAQKIVIELKGKVDDYNVSLDSENTHKKENEVYSQVYEALLGLGYSSREIDFALSQIPENFHDVISTIKLALVYLKKHVF